MAKEAIEYRQALLDAVLSELNDLWAQANGALDEFMRLQLRESLRRLDLAITLLRQADDLPIDAPAKRWRVQNPSARETDSTGSDDAVSSSAPPAPANRASSGPAWAWFDG